MKRGQTWMFGVVIIFAGIFFMFLIGAQFAGQTTEEGQRAFAENYINNLIGEQMMQLPCATEKRGVFYHSSIASGDFHCFSTHMPNQPVYLRFEYESGEVYEWQLKWISGVGTRVKTQLMLESFHSQTYDIIIKDTQSNENIPGTLKIGAEIDDDPFDT